MKKVCMCVAWLVSFRALNYSPMQISADEGGGGGGGVAVNTPCKASPLPVTVQPGAPLGAARPR